MLKGHKDNFDFSKIFEIGFDLQFVDTNKQEAILVPLQHYLNLVKENGYLTGRIEELTKERKVKL